MRVCAAQNTMVRSQHGTPWRSWVGNTAEDFRDILRCLSHLAESVMVSDVYELLHHGEFHWRRRAFFKKQRDKIHRTPRNVIVEL